MDTLTSVSLAGTREVDSGEGAVSRNWGAARLCSDPVLSHLSNASWPGGLLKMKIVIKPHPSLKPTFLGYNKTQKLQRDLFNRDLEWLILRAASPVSPPQLPTPHPQTVSKRLEFALVLCYLSIFSGTVPCICTVPLLTSPHPRFT